MISRDSSSPTFDEPIESVAVGVPTKDNENSIRATLESLVEQNRQPDRIIVVDASTDRTPDIVRDIANSTDVQITLLEETTHGRGISAARQQIYEELEEDLLACLDTEKRVDPSWMETHLMFHRDHPEFGILNAGPKVSGRVTDSKCFDFFVQANCSIKREALEILDGWDRWMNRGEDWDFRIRLWGSGIDSYSLPTLQADPVKKENRVETVSKMMARPGCVAFLRKYGFWYFTFHPVHVVGDIVSTVSLILTILAILITPVTIGGAAMILLFPLAAFIAHLYVAPLQETGTDAFEELAFRIPYFYLLGYTALCELIYAENYDWNYGGIYQNGS